MINILAINKSFKQVPILSLEDVNKDTILWYWADFSNPNKEEISLLDSHFHFHPLSIEDCVMALNRPKLDYYNDYNFFILNALNQKTLAPIEVALFVGENYIVSFHTSPLKEIDEAWNRVSNNNEHWDKGTSYIVHQILDKIVDQYFPAIYMIEDYLDRVEINEDKQPIHQQLNEVFDIRTDLIKLRRIVNSMRDLLYRIVNSDRLTEFEEHKLYFSDIYDHLLKLSDMVESNRDMTSDIRDSYLSMSSNRMNTNMMILTVITTIFIPLTFIAGVYGMNFENMPELKWEYGYFIVLFFMALIGFMMFLWFKRKGWFDI